MRYLKIYEMDQFYMYVKEIWVKSHPTMGRNEKSYH